MLGVIRQRGLAEHAQNRGQHMETRNIVGKMVGGQRRSKERAIEH